MSCIFIGVGQCGNQLSSTLLDYLSANKTNQTSFLFTHYDDKFHFVNLDSEPKVINGLSNDHRNNLRLENLINTKCGRGSNWASGYAGLEKDGALKIIDKSIESIRREAERCDFLLNFNIMHSLSGGTGSGCGSKLIERIRDEFGSKKYIFNQSVAPFVSGEMPLQHYNNLLCLSHLQEFSDCITIYHNDEVFNQIERQHNEQINSQPSNTKSALLPFNKLKKSTSNESLSAGTISLNQMNSHIVKSFLNLIYPVENVSLKTQSIGMEFFELQRVLCSNPNLKIIEIYNVNDSSSNNYNNKSSLSNTSSKSNPLLKQLLHTIPKYKRDHLDNQYVSLNSLLIARGSQNLSSDNYNSKLIMSQIWQDFDQIKKHLNPVEWNPFSFDFWCSKYSLNNESSSSSSSFSSSSASTNKSLKSTNNSLTLATNRNKCVDYLKDVVYKSREKYEARAYLHWYHKFNISDEQFEYAFESMQTIIDSYNAMTDK